MQKSALLNDTLKSNSSSGIDCAKECPCGVPVIPVPDQWLEVMVTGGFKVWHIIFIIIAFVITMVVVYCCFHRCRIPRTKQEIEADLMRTNIANKFRDYVQELPNEPTTFVEALKKVQTMEEKLEQDDAAMTRDLGARKRMGWLKLKGKGEKEPQAKQEDKGQEAGDKEEPKLADNQVYDNEVGKSNGLSETTAAATKLDVIGAESQDRPMANKVNETKVDGLVSAMTDISNRRAERASKKQLNGEKPPTKLDQQKPDKEKTKEKKSSHQKQPSIPQTNGHTHSGDIDNHKDNAEAEGAQSQAVKQVKKRKPKPNLSRTKGAARADKLQPEQQSHLDLPVPPPPQPVPVVPPTRPDPRPGPREASAEKQKSLERKLLEPPSANGNRKTKRHEHRGKRADDKKTGGPN